MAGMFCEVNIGETKTTTLVEPSTKSTMKIVKMHQFNFGPDSGVASGGERKRRKLEAVAPISRPARKCMCEFQRFEAEDERKEIVHQLKNCEKKSETKEFELPVAESEHLGTQERVKFGTTSVRGRRRDMEDAVAIHPSFCGRNSEFPGRLHFFGVFDGHGCSHVAIRCKDRMHEIVKDEVENGGESSWKHMMSESFLKMDKDVIDWSNGDVAVSTSVSGCRCRMQSPQCDAVGSTAVVAVVSPDKIIVSNCGDSRAVLCRNGVAIPLSVDHKPDRADELRRIEESGGRVIFWDCPRVLGVLAMSRAIGDNYLKPHVVPEPEVTTTQRTAEDECLILASDGLWDVVSNQTACRVARMCLQSRKQPSTPESPGSENVVVAEAGESSDKACADASMLLTRLALARRSTDNVSVVVVDLRRS